MNPPWDSLTPGFLDDEAASALRQGLLLGAAVLTLVLPPARPLPAGLPHLPPPPLAQQLDAAGATASPDAQRLLQWVLASGDAGRRSFAVIDKKAAQVLVFDADGHLLGATPVLLGYAAGDDSVPGIGQRPIEQVRPEERTTPAGRFVAQAGRNALGEEVVWVDYAAAVSMHRVRLTQASERRLERLASPTPDDNRISYGCINMPPAFFEQVLWPALGRRQGVVYVLPEHKTLEAVFPGVRTSRQIGL
jgi:hypothetical protein